MRRTRQGQLLLGSCGAAAIAAALLSAAPAQVLAQAGRPEAATAAVDPALVREQVESLLRHMSAAVSSADSESYLACVSMVDSCFATEQRNWAKDLTRKPPERFDVAIEDDEFRMGDDGAAEARIKWTWQMPGARERTISFTARFVRGELGWLYGGEKWNVLEGERCRILYVDGLQDAAKAAAEVLPEVRAHVHEGFELTGDKEITERIQQVKLYSSMRHLQHSIYLSYSDGLGGWNEPREAVKVLGTRRTSSSFLRTLLAHEYGHVATFHLGPKATDMPWWILEGVAELSAEKFARNGATSDRIVRKWAAAGRLLDWEKLADFHGEAADHYAEVYTQGHAMVRYVSDRFGREGRNRWLRELSQGTDLAAATRAALGVEFAELDRQWRQSLDSGPGDGETQAKPATGDGHDK